MVTADCCSEISFLLLFFIVYNNSKPIQTTATCQPFTNSPNFFFFFYFAHCTSFFQTFRLCSFNEISCLEFKLKFVT